ncbi:MAG TPA: DUF362 domain-containing protein, partial [Desulfurivibrionaceae bacterium]|nr:DUF362 domain-containing protein [Desulfurivibrionaceae bacterium]
MMLNRRDFVAGSAGGLLVLATGEVETIMAASGKKNGPARVALVKNRDRFTAVQAALDLLGVNPVGGKKVLLKPNFNTADPFPAGTHNDTLRALARKLKGLGAGEITIGERCGPPETAEVLREKGIAQLCREEGLGLINFEDLPDSEWVRVSPAGSHWHDGFEVARPVLAAECVVATCCLKTHGYGGVFTMSLKLAVGITRKRNMTELHGSLFSMRKMIAEINLAYAPGLILMDGLEIFTDGGPAHGTLKKPGVMLAGTDRVAIDAVGLAVLKQMGSNRKIMETPIFEQEQIARAVELGLGVSSAKD